MPAESIRCYVTSLFPLMVKCCTTGVEYRPLRTGRVAVLKVGWHGTLIGETFYPDV